MKERKSAEGEGAWQGRRRKDMRPGSGGSNPSRRSVRWGVLADKGMTEASPESAIRPLPCPGSRPWARVRDHGSIWREAWQTPGETKSLQVSKHPEPGSCVVAAHLHLHLHSCTGRGYRTGHSPRTTDHRLGCACRGGAALPCTSTPYALRPLPSTLAPLAARRAQGVRHALAVEPLTPADLSLEPPVGLPVWRLRSLTVVAHLHHHASVAAGAAVLQLAVRW